MDDLLDIRKKVIGLAGAKHAGKDTVADYLVETYGFVKFAYADPVKQACAAAFGVDVAIFYDQNLKEEPLPELLGHTPRFLMQTLGTGWGRDMVSRSIWTDILRKHAENALSGGFSVVVSDVRYDNEAEVIKALGGHIVRIFRPEVENSGDNHSSEAGITPHFYDFRVRNDADFRLLYAQVGVILENIDRQAARRHRPDRNTAL